MNIFSDFFNIKYDKNYAVRGLTPDLFALYIYNKFLKVNESILLITNTVYEASNLYEKISRFTEKVLFFPMDDFLTSEAIAISPEFKIERVITLNSMSQGNKLIVITNLMGLLRFLPTKEVWEKNVIKVKKGLEYNRDKLIKDLYNIGYEVSTIVSKTGEFGIRGYVLDIFPIGNENPIRIEFWGDNIDSIKLFDVDSQLTKREISSIDIIPATEFLLDEIEKVKDNEEKKQKYLPKYTKNYCNISKYLDKYYTFYFDYNQIKIGYNSLINTIFEYNLSLSNKNTLNYMYNLEDINLMNEIYLLNFDNILSDKLNINIEDYDSKKIDNYKGNYNKLNDDLNMFLTFNKTVVLCLNNNEEINRIVKYISNKNVYLTDYQSIHKGSINIINYSIDNGFIYEDWVVISSNDLFGETVRKFKGKYKIGTKIGEISNLKKGDLVVHEQFGIGMYEELATINKNGMKKDYIKLIYADDDILYIPVEYIDRITKFSGSEGNTVKLNKLGTKDWERKKQKVKKQIDDMVADLISISASRETEKGYSFKIEDENQVIFDGEFPYEETIDQISAIKKIKKEMENEKPMDLLLCGDVGYGKTEVAFRAMFKAVNNGKQVAYLCPTTVLSMQQYKNAINRFSTFPINIELINRFVPLNRQKEILDNLKTGKIDILFGTHRLLSSDVKYKNLGLLVIDEEQRFGVKHKEQIKKYKTQIDVLTLSATPIPRTLQMSISGVRSLALIETPPEQRYPIQTYVLEENDVIIRDAIYKELARGGQIFLLYNSIARMNMYVNKIKKLVPEAKIDYANGQMDKKQLENKMIDFVNNKFNVLISTTIIETGIDIPNANTLIVLEADRFGLAQLYQIRGRIGRSNKIAYAYLMYNKNKILTESAIKRLETIKDFTALGSGFKIAMRDLSIRGAGNILGKEQSGFINSIGIDLYLKMLSEAINKIKGKNSKIESEKSNKPLLEVDTHIDDGYINNSDLKIEIHRKINSIDSYDKLEEIKLEIEDRFGKIDENMNIYMYSEWFEKIAKDLNITDINQTKNNIDITLPKDIVDKIGLDELFILAYDINKKFRFSNRNGKIHIILEFVNLQDHFIKYLIDLVLKIKELL